MEIKGNKFKVNVKAGAKENSIVGYDDSKGHYRVSVKARAQGGRANSELVKFLSKKLGRRVRIVSGFRGREKVLGVE